MGKLLAYLKLAHRLAGTTIDWYADHKPEWDAEKQRAEHEEREANTEEAVWDPVAKVFRAKPKSNGNP